MRSCRTLTCLLSFYLISTACSSDETAQSHSFQIIEEDGVSVALTSGGPRYQGELFDYEPILHMQEDEREESLLFSPGKFITDEDGNYYVLDSGSADIAIYNQEGRFQRRIGGKGAGPGEFRFPQLVCVRDGIIHVFDRGQNRATRYRTSGELINVVQLPNVQQMITDPSEPRTTLGGFLQVDEDRYLMTTSTMRYDHTGFFTRPGASMVTASDDTLWSIQVPEVQLGITKNMRQGDFTFLSPVIYPFGPSISCTICPGIGIVVVGGWEAVLDIYDMQGRLTRRIRVEGLQDPVTEKDKQEVVDYYRGAIENSTIESQKEMLEEQIDGLVYSKYKGAFGRIKYCDAGYIYVGANNEFGPARSGEKGITYYVFSPEGEYIGNTTRPGGRSSEVCGGRLLVTTANPETTEDMLTVYAMKPVPAGFHFP